MRFRKSRTPATARAFSISCERWYSSRRSAPAQKSAFTVLWMMSACACRAILSSASANFSSSSRASEPISLQGSRCSASSMTPAEISHESALPRNWSIGIRLPLHRNLYAIHFVDLVAQLPRNQVALELSIRRQQPVFNRERLRADVKRAHLLVMWELWIHRIDGSLRFFARDVARDDRG